MAWRAIELKAMLAMTAVAAAISLGVSHAAAAQDREAQANRLFDISEQIQQSGPCRDLPFLWLTNEKIIAFLDALTSGEYESATQMLPEYIACFEHQTDVVEIRPDDDIVNTVTVYVARRRDRCAGNIASKLTDDFESVGPIEVGEID